MIRVLAVVMAFGVSGCGSTSPNPNPNPNPAEKPSEPGKDVKLTGTLLCGKCALHETSKCANALQVKDGDKTVNYFLEDQGSGEDYHACGGDQVEGVTVAGTATEKDGKHYLKPIKVDLPKK